MAKAKFINYKGQTHQGPNEGIPIDQLGNPTMISKGNTIGLVEEGEVGYLHPKNDTIIFSKSLGFADKANKIKNKYKFRLGTKLNKSDKFSEASLERQLNSLSKEQEDLNSKNDMIEIKKLQKGGKLPKYATGFNFENLNADQTGAIGVGGNLLGSGIQALDGMDGSTSAFGQIGGGAIKGAAAGMALGPVGALVGGAIGGIGGAFKNKQNQDQAAELQSQQDLQNLNKRKALFNSNLDPTTPNVPTFSKGTRLPKYEFGETKLNPDVMNPNIQNNGLGVYDPNILPQDVNQQDDQMNLFQKNLPYIAGQTALTTLGNLGLASRYGKPLETEDINTTPVRAPQVDYGNSRREITRQTNLAKRGAIRRSSGLRGGARQSNLAATNIGLNRNLGSSLSQSYEDQANQNANLQFQADRINAAQNLAAEQANVGARNLSNREAQLRKLGLYTSAMGGLQHGFQDVRDVLTQEEILNAEALRTPYYHKKNRSLGVRK